MRGMVRCDDSARPPRPCAGAWHPRRGVQRPRTPWRAVAAAGHGRDRVKAHRRHERCPPAKSPCIACPPTVECPQPALGRSYQCSWCLLGFRLSRPAVRRPSRPFVSRTYGCRLLRRALALVCALAHTSAHARCRYIHTCAHTHARTHARTIEAARRGSAADGLRSAGQCRWRNCRCASQVEICVSMLMPISVSMALCHLSKRSSTDICTSPVLVYSV